MELRFITVLKTSHLSDKKETSGNGSNFASSFNNVWKRTEEHYSYVWKFCQNCRDECLGFSYFELRSEQYVQVLVNNTTIYILKMFNKGW